MGLQWQEALHERMATVDLPECTASVDSSFSVTVTCADAEERRLEVTITFPRTGAYTRAQLVFTPDGACPTPLYDRDAGDSGEPAPDAEAASPDADGDAATGDQ